MRYLKQLVFLIPIITLFSCTSVNTFIQDNDYSGLQAFCEQKETEAEREACFAEAAKSAAEKNPSMAYQLYMKLGNDTHKVSYYNQAGELARSLIPEDPDMMEKAVNAFEAAGNDEGLIASAIEQSSCMKWGQKDLPWDLLEKTAEKYTIKEVYKNLAALASGNDKGYAAEKYDKAGMMKEAQKLYFEVAQKNLEKKYYTLAAEAYAAGGDQKSAAKYWLMAADKSLNARNPQFESVLSYYEKAGKAEDGKRRVAKQMIEERYKPTMEEGLKIAESVSPEFHKEALILAATVYFSKNSYTAKGWFKEAGIDDVYGQMAEVYLAKSSPNFLQVENYFKKSKKRNYAPLLLQRAVEVGNSHYMLKYAEVATGKDQHEKVAYALLESDKYDEAYTHFQQSDVENGALLIAEKATGHVNKLLAPKFFYLGGERKKGIQLWTEAVQWVIETEQFLQSYLSLNDPPTELMEIYWKDILEYYRAKDNIMAMAPLKLLEIDQPILAIGFIHNSHRLDYLSGAAATLNKSKSVLSKNMGKKFNQESNLNAQFNKLLTALATNETFRAPQYKSAFKELEKAQIELLKRNFQQMEKHTDIAKSELGI